MKIAVVQASSQISKNEMLFQYTKKYAKDSEVINFGCFENDTEKYSYLDIAVLIGLLINNIIVDFLKEDENTENVYLVKDGTLFLLYGRKDFEKLTSKRFEYLQGINAHSEMALYVDTFQEVDEQYQNAISKGASSLLEPTTEPWGQRTCFIADPEGNVIEIDSWNKPYEEKDS